MNGPLLKFGVIFAFPLNVSSPDFAGDEAWNSWDQVQELPCCKYLNKSLRLDNQDGDKTQDYYYLSFIFHLRSIPRWFTRQPVFKETVLHKQVDSLLVGLDMHAELMATIWWPQLFSA